MSNIDPFVNTKVVVLHEDVPAIDAARAMCEHKIGAIVVANHESHITGIVTDRDLVCGLFSVNLAPDTPVSEIMSKDPVCANENSTIEEVIALMRANGIRRIPILHQLKSNQEKCVGMVTLDDLIANQFIDYKDLAKIVASQIIRKRKFRHRLLPLETKNELAMEVFIEDVAKGLDIDTDKANRFVYFVLGSVTERLHFSAAVHLASQLPVSLEKALLELPSGPNRAITADYVVRGVMNRLLVKEPEAKEMLERFWSILINGVGADVMDHIAHQLPKDMQLVFLPQPLSA